MRQNTYETVWEVLSKGNELLKKAKSLFSTIILWFTMSLLNIKHLTVKVIMLFMLVFLALPWSDVVWFLFLRSVGIFQSFGSLFCVALFQKWINFWPCSSCWLEAGSRPGHLLRLRFHLLCCFSMITRIVIWEANEANLHMVPVRFDLNRPLNLCKTHMQAHVQTNTHMHAHTHMLCRVCWKNVPEEVTLQACSGLDSVLSSDRKHHSYICVSTLSFVESLVYLVVVILLSLPVSLVTHFIQNYFGA